MHNLIVEEYPDFSTKDLVRHLYTRMWNGQVVIVAKEPQATMVAVRKHWLKLARKVQQERTKAQDPIRIQSLSETIVRMHSLRFTADWPPDDYMAEVYVVTVDQLVQWAPECRTMYVTCNVERDKLHIITAWMARGSLVVFCSFVATTQL